MPMPTQIKLLRVLEEREITRVGDNKPIPVNVRVLAATNKDLEKEIEAGRFRSDLYFRLKIVSVHLDKLNKRREDILPLADFFRKQANKKNGRKIKGFTQDLRRWMLGYQWKGNVRQLKNVVESLVVMDIDEMLDMDDLSPDLIDENTSLKSTPSAGTASAAASSSKEPDGGTETGTDAVAENPQSAESNEDDFASSSLVGKSLKDIERLAIEHTLTLANHNREETARILGISERNLYRKLNEYGLR